MYEVESVWSLLMAFCQFQGGFPLCLQSLPTNGVTQDYQQDLYVQGVMHYLYIYIYFSFRHGSLFIASPNWFSWSVAEQKAIFDQQQTSYHVAKPILTTFMTCFSCSNLDQGPQWHSKRMVNPLNHFRPARNQVNMFHWRELLSEIHSM